MSPQMVCSENHEGKSETCDLSWHKGIYPPIPFHNVLLLSFQNDGGDEKKKKENWDEIC